MRLAYLHYLYGDDTALNHVRQFSEAARTQGAVVDIYAMNLAPSLFLQQNSQEPTLGLRARQALKKRFSRYLHEPKELLWNLKYIRKENDLLGSRPPDVLLVRDHYITSSCVRVARRLDLPLVIEVNAPAAEASLYMNEYMRIPLLAGRLERYKLRNAEAITVVSTALKDYLVGLHSLPPEKVTVVPNGADTSRFHANLVCGGEDPKLSEDTCVVGFVGSFQKWHGSELLGQMAIQVGAARENVRFLFVGDGPEAPSVRKDCEDLGTRARFVGRVPHQEVPEWVACFDVGVVAEAGFYMSPLKILEWMAAGRAVVAPRYGPIEEIIDDGVDGLLFTPGDLSDLVSTVLRFVDDSNLKKTLGLAAAARVRSSLTWNDNARKVLEVCQRSLDRRRPAPVERQ